MNWICQLLLEIIESFSFKMGLIMSVRLVDHCCHCCLKRKVKVLTGGGTRERGLYVNGSHSLLQITGNHFPPKMSSYAIVTFVVDSGDYLARRIINGVKSLFQLLIRYSTCHKWLFIFERLFISNLSDSMQTALYVLDILTFCSHASLTISN